MRATHGVVVLFGLAVATAQAAGDATAQAGGGATAHAAGDATARLAGDAPARAAGDARVPADRVAAGGAPLAPVATGDAAAGERVFQLCAACHAVGPSARSGFGPSLHGIVGRRAGTAADFKYSEAMQRSGIVWTEATLAAFVRDPGAVVPGTRMRFYGLGDDRKIADLIVYLRGA